MIAAVCQVLLRQAMLGRMRTLLLYGGLIVLLATGLAWSLADLALSPLAGISAQPSSVAEAAWAVPAVDRTRAIAVSAPGLREWRRGIGEAMAARRTACAARILRSGCDAPVKRHASPAPKRNRPRRACRQERGGLT